MPVDDQDGGDQAAAIQPADPANDLSEFGVTGEELVEQLPDPTEAPPELVETFVIVVVLVNISLFVTTLGLLLLFIPRWIRIGGALTAIGMLGGGWAYYRYRRFQQT